MIPMLLYLIKNNQDPHIIIFQKEWKIQILINMQLMRFQNQVIVMKNKKNMFPNSNVLQVWKFQETSAMI